MKREFTPDIGEIYSRMSRREMDEARYEISNELEELEDANNSKSGRVRELEDESEKIGDELMACASKLRREGDNLSDEDLLVQEEYLKRIEHLIWRLDGKFASLRGENFSFNNLGRAVDYYKDCWYIIGDFRGKTRGV